MRVWASTHSPAQRRRLPADLRAPENSSCSVRDSVSFGESDCMLTIVMQQQLQASGGGGGLPSSGAPWWKPCTHPTASSDECVLLIIIGIADAESTAQAKAACTACQLHV